MIDEERNCVDILTQVAAIRSAVDQFGIVLLSTHLEKCVSDRVSVEAGFAGDSFRRIDEIRSSLEHFLQTTPQEA
jgi:DNA-binding FrmR family transcriptional regulator